MEDLRHLNLFEKITKIRAKSCFEYNRTFFFCVDKRDLYKAIGKDSKNLKKIGSILSKRIKIIEYPKTTQMLSSFIKAIVFPIEFNEAFTEGENIILTTPKQTKAILIGRNKTRLFEMKKIIKNFFGKEFKIK